MIEAARRARRQDRQSRDARFAQAMRAPPACNFGHSELVPCERLGVDPTRSLPTEGGSDGQRGVAPPLAW
jgi:hypothetical protein